MKLSKHSTLSLKPTLVAFSAAGILLSSAAFAQGDSNATVVVDEKAPQIRMQQPAPEVTVNQTEAQVEVATGQPEVSVEQPEPEVTIEQPKPEVNIEQPEPEVVVNDADPQVEVKQADPEVTINSAEPEVEVVNLDQNGEQKKTQNVQASRDLMQVELDKLKEKTVVNAQGEELGGVDDIVMSRQGDQKGFVVSVGGILGIGDTQVFVPANEVKVTGDNIVWETSQSEDQIKKSSEYRADQFQSVSDQYNTLGELQSAS